MNKKLHLRVCILTYIMFYPFIIFAKNEFHADKQVSNKGFSFIENKGQIIDQYGKNRKDIDFKLLGSYVVMYIGNGELHYQWCKPVPKINSQEKNQNPQAELYRLDVTLLGANKNAQVITEDIQPYYENYYLPQTPDGVTVHSFKRITYKNIYPFIDWVLYTTDDDKGVKYDFVIHPGGNPAAIQIQYNGATSLKLVNGALVATTPYGKITEDAPYSYYAADKEVIVSSYKLHGNIVSFYINTGTTKKIVIDPLLRWGTYYGGSDDEVGLKCTADSFGNAYMVGVTKSTSNIATSGAFQTTVSTQRDGFLVKFSSAGVRQWGTYYGGSLDDDLVDVACDSTGNVYVCGITLSSGLATSGSHQSTYTGAAKEAILIKFNSAGGRQWATYYGNTGNDEAFSVVCDAVQNVYIGGGTSSTTGIATSGSYQSSLAAGLSAAFLVKFNPAGVRQWGTYYGVTGESILALTCDPNGYIIAAGETQTNGLSTSGVFMTTVPAGINYISYVVKFNYAGQRQWCTYYGGNDLDRITSISSDPVGNIYVAGGTSSTTGVATTGAHQTSRSGNLDGFIGKLNKTGNRVWATYYGGTGNNDQIHGIAAGPENKVYVFGFTPSSNAISTLSSHQTSLAGINDLFFTVFTSSGTRMYGTYYGGTDLDGSTVIAASGGGICFSKGLVYFSSTTKSTSGIATIGAHQTAYASAVTGSGWGDACLVQFAADTAVYIVQPFRDTTKCPGDTVRIPYRVTHNFRSTNIFTIQMSNGSGSFASPTTLATISGNTNGQYNWVVPTTVTPGNGYRVRIIATAPVDTFVEEYDIKLALYPTTTATSNSPICSGNTLNLAATSSMTGMTWSWTGPGGYTSTAQNPSRTSALTTYSGDYIVTATNQFCSAKDTVTVLVKQTPATPTASNNGPLCNNGILNLTANSTTPGVSYDWSGPSFTSTAQNPVINPATTANSGTYDVFATLNGCSSGTATTLVTVLAGPTVNVFASPNDSVCVGASTQFSAVITNAGTAPSYQWLKNGNPISGAMGTVYTTSTLATGDVISFLLTPGAGAACNTPVNSNSIAMTVLPYTTPTVDITATDTVAWPGLLIRFNAVNVNGGASPKYQWQLNNQNVIGATSDNWGTTTLANNDSVCVIMTPDFLCANPATAKACKRIRINTGIKGIIPSSMKIYPNPTNDVLFVEGAIVGTALRLVDVFGRVVSTINVKTDLEVLNLNALPSGIYVLSVATNNEIISITRIVKE